MGLVVLYKEALTPEQPGWTRMLMRDFDVRWYWFPTAAEERLLGNTGWPLFPVSAAMRMYYLTGNGTEQSVIYGSRFGRLENSLGQPERKSSGIVGFHVERPFGQFGWLKRVE